VINMSGLPDQGAQQQFINSCDDAVFLDQEEPARGRALQGLLVIDERAISFPL